MSVMFTLSQTAFWGRNDDGSLAAATGKAAQNTNWNQNVDENFRVRFVLQETAGAAGTTGVLQLQYSLNGGGFTNVTGSSSVVQAFSTANYTDGAATANHASITGSGTFVAGTADSSDGAVASVSLGASNHTEVEFCVQILSADVVNNDTVDLRCFATATNSPSITVVAPTIHNGEASLDATADISVSGEKETPGGGGNPRKVQNLVATAVSTSQINLSWDDVTIIDPVAYDIERDGIVIVENYTGSHSVGSPYQDTGLSPATLYQYRVRAVGGTP